MNGYIPTVIENDGRAQAQFDLPSRLLKDRIIILNDQVASVTAYGVNMQLMYLDNNNKEGKDINLYINSPGGSVYDGMSILDTINSLKCKVNIVATGMAASMGAFLLTTGTGLRAATPEARIMVHSVSSGTRGTVHDMEIDGEETKFLNNRLHTLMYNKMSEKITDEGKKIITETARMPEFNLETFIEYTSRDRWLSAQEALEIGIIDKIVGV